MYQQIEQNKRKTIVLVSLFILVVLLIGWAFAETTELGYGALAIAGVIAVFMSLTSYFSGDKVALKAAGATGPLQANDNPYVYRMVENLSITTGLPMPKVYIIPDSAINAFATGRDPQHASVAITQGAIDKLENEELEGVLAHELAHIKNYDIRLMMVVLVLIGLIALLSDWFLRIQFFGGGKHDNNRGNNNLGAILMVVGIVLLILSPIIGKLIQFAISRKREFLADASAALITRYPEGLARALEKINASSVPLKKAHNATAHLFIANPFGATSKKMSKLFATHPPIEERVAALRSMA